MIENDEYEDEDEVDGEIPIPSRIPPLSSLIISPLFESNPFDRLRNGLSEYMRTLNVEDDDDSPPTPAP